ncbi:MAG: rhomboid family intramembrane serine protease [Geobacteraceae bacterium]|nr:rhomboid family intramembrane serine protease [Geobacteraceae bacterium]
MDSAAKQISIADDDWVRIKPELIDESFLNLTSQHTRLWSLVLDARFIPCQIRETSGEWLLLVPPYRFDEACVELRRFERENHHWPPVPPLPRPMIENNLATFSVLLVLAVFYNITRLDVTAMDGIPIDWERSGSAHAGKILNGEWWRLVTALTLHTDALHLISNLTIGGVFVLLLCRELGSGLAWTLMLSAGAAGNLCNALLQSRQHDSVGSSTAVFGVVGILSALSLVRYRHYLRRRWPLPVASALALLSFLGTEGKNADLGAHLFGFLAGVVIGLITEILISRYGQPSRWLNALLALLGGIIVVTAWMMALASG